MARETIKINFVPGNPIPSNDLNNIGKNLLYILDQDAIFNNKKTIVVANGGLPDISPFVGLIVQRNALTEQSSFINIISGTAGQSGVYFGDSTNANVGILAYNNSTNSFDFTVAGSQSFKMTATKKFLVNTTIEDESFLKVVKEEGALPPISPTTVGLLQRNVLSEQSCDFSLIAGITGYSRLNFGDTTNENTGQIAYNHSTEEMSFRIANSVRIVATATGIDILGLLSTSTLKVGASGSTITEIKWV